MIRWWYKHQQLTFYGIADILQTKGSLAQFSLVVLATFTLLVFIVHIMRCFYNYSKISNCRSTFAEMLPTKKCYLKSKHIT